MTGWFNVAFRSLFTSKERVLLPARDAPAANAPHIRLSLDQGSEKWHSWRSGMIGASDAPVIMGENPWKSAARLLAEKNGLSERFRGNEKTRRGTALQPTARSLYEMRNKMKVPPAVLQRRDRLWQCASVDGLDSTGSRVVEIKCGEGVYRHVERYRAPPTYYVGQLQHILAVTDLHVIHLLCYWPGKPELLIDVPRDQKYIDRLIEEEERFFKRVQRR